MKRLALLLLALACAPASALELAWAVQLASPGIDPYAKLTPVWAEGRVCAFAWDGHGACLDPTDGRLLWYRDDLGGVSGGPTYADGDFFYGTREGGVIAWDEARRRVLWRADLGSEVLAPPVRAGDLLLVQTLDDRLYALDLRDGAVVWTHERSMPPLSLRGTAAPVVSDGLVFAGFSGGQLVALRLEDGALRWETAVAIPRGRSDLERMVDVDATPLPGEGLVYAGAFQGRLMAVRREDGEVAWERRLSLYRALVDGDGALYLSDADGAVLRIDPQSGATLWRQAALPAPATGAPARVGGRLLVATRDGALVALDPEDGRLLARIDHQTMALGVNAYLADPGHWESDDDIDLARLFRHETAPAGLPLVKDGMVFQLFQDGLFAAFRP